MTSVVVGGTCSVVNYLLFHGGEIIHLLLSVISHVVFLIVLLLASTACYCPNQMCHLALT